MIKVSVIIPTYNRKQTLLKTLDSVLAQTYPRDLYEVIVVDDGSIDGTEEALEPLLSRILYFKQENKGPATARNLGITHARGEIVAFTDDDCVVPLNWIEALVYGFRRYPDVVGVGGYMEADEETLATNVYARYESYVTHRVFGLGDKDIYGEHVPIATNCAAYKKEILEELGGFDESFRNAAGEDADLNLRIASCGYKTLFVPIKVIHIQEYSLRSLQRRCILRGMAGAQIAVKQRRIMQCFVSTCFQIVIGPLLFLKDLLTDYQKSEASIYCLANFLIGISKIWSLLIFYKKEIRHGA